MFKKHLGPEKAYKNKNEKPFFGLIYQKLAILAMVNLHNKHFAHSKIERYKTLKSVDHALSG